MSVNWDAVTAIISASASPFLGVIGVIAKHRYDRHRDARAERLHQEEHAEQREEKLVATDVQRQDADTRQFQALLEGYSNQVRDLLLDNQNLRITLQEQNKRIAGQDRVIASLEERVTAAEAELQQATSERQQYLDHITHLEALIPPPGPPPRPWATVRPAPAT